MKYDSAYENGAAVEAFVYRMSGEKALLVSYDIMSPENAKKREERRTLRGKRNEKPTKKSAKPSAKRADRPRNHDAWSPVAFLTGGSREFRR